MALIGTKGDTTPDLKNNGATVVMGGNVDTAKTGRPHAVTNAPGMTHINTPNSAGARRRGDHRNNPQARTTLGTQTTKGSGTFAYVMLSGKFVGKRMATEINGVTTAVTGDTLLSGGRGKGHRSRTAIHYLETTRALGVNTWNYATGAITKGGTAGNAVQFIDPASGGGSTAADSAARPTRAIPGELVYTDHGMAFSGSLAVALSDDYKAKTG